jgi:hypothetical protein
VSCQQQQQQQQTRQKVALQARPSLIYQKRRLLIINEAAAAAFLPFQKSPKVSAAAADIVTHFFPFARNLLSCQHDRLFKEQSLRLDTVRRLTG